MKRLVLHRITLLIVVMGVIGGCGMSHDSSKGASAGPGASTAAGFADDVAFLKSHGPVIVLSDPAGKSKVAIAPTLQGRVMTSTAAGDSGTSFGWINRAYFTDAAAGKMNPHISAWGGEDRIWLGPEGGQFSIFFAPGAAFDLDHWFTPKWIDVEPFNTVSTTPTAATFRRDVSFSNYSGTPFNVRIDRTIHLLDKDNVARLLNISTPAGVNVVAFETNNRITNTGSSDCSKHTGLLSIWILGMFNATSATTVVIPIRPGEGQAVNDDYFGHVPPDRLKTIDNIVYFKADANCRSKIGISPRRATPILGSYDSAHHVLTIIQYTFDESAADYVNSAWKMQDNPFGGDVANSYNDGPPPSGKPQLGRFYELESSSAARELKKGQSLEHTQRTMHFQGDEKSLDAIARRTLGVGLSQIQAAMR
jgi:Family of unknown function (DUF6786)